MCIIITGLFGDNARYVAKKRNLNDYDFHMFLIEIMNGLYSVSNLHNTAIILSL